MSRLVPITNWPHIDPGKLRHRINIQSKSLSVDQFGGQTATPTTLLSCKAAIETMSTKEQFQDGFVSEVVHIITIRWPGPSYTILPSMQVVVNPVPGGVASVYQIQAVENVQQRNLLVVLTCVEINNATVSS